MEAIRQGMDDALGGLKSDATEVGAVVLMQSDIVGLKYFDQLLPLLARLKEDGCLRDKAGNRELHYDQYCYLHMAGSPSQLELFDDKPELKKLHLQDAPKAFLEGKRFAFIKGVPKILAGQFKFAKHGECGQSLSELLPNLAKVVDKMCVIRTVHTDQFNHAPAQLFEQTGTPRLGNPSLGSWVTYGLGSVNDDLPGFVVLLSGGKTPDAGKSLWGAGFLPGVYQGVQCRTAGDPVPYLCDPQGMDRAMRRRMLDTLAKLNEAEQRRSGDAETLTRIAQYELVAA